jgi:hypothetical protein
MADIVKGIKATCTILGYADYWVVVTSSKPPIKAEISTEKTKIMLIHTRRPRTEGNTRFKLRVLIETEKIEMVK